MITPEWYTYEFDLLKTHKALQEEILRDIARRIAATDMSITETAAWQAEMAQKSGILYDDLIKEIAKRTGGTTAEIRQIFKDAKVEVFNYDNEMLLENGQDPEAIKYISPKMQNAMKSALTKTSTEAKNLTKTTALTSQSAYLQACDLAHQKVVSGAFSYQSAIKTAIKFAAGQGVKVVYPSGHISSLDVAIRRSVLTGVNQTAGHLQNMRAGELDCDIMEISAHSGARPSHAVWQGQLVSRSGASGYLSLDDIGYGEVTGFMGANCRHNWYMYFGGMRMYTSEELSKINNRTVTYNDTEYAEYDALQIQRKFERDIRKYKTELVMYDEAMKTADGDISEIKTEFGFTAQKLKAKESALKDFCEQTNLRRDRYREQVFAVDTEKKISNFGRSTSSKAVWANKKALTNGDNGGIIKEQNKKNITIISDKAIENIQKVNIAGYTDEQCTVIQQQHKELLKYAKDNNNNNEVAFVFRKDLTDRAEFIGSDESLDFGSGLFGKGKDLFVMHNHPRNSSFSDRDIMFLLQNDSVHTLTIVKNNGLVETLSKTIAYDKRTAITELSRQYKKHVKVGNEDEISKAINKFLNKYTEGLEWINTQ